MLKSLPLPTLCAVAPSRLPRRAAPGLSPLQRAPGALKTLCRNSVLALLCMAGVGTMESASAQQRVELPTLEPGVAGAGSASQTAAAPGAPLQLLGHWYASPVAGPRPAVVLLHGCGGAYDKSGALSARMREYAKLLTGEGWHVLVLDSLSPRGETELCTQKLGERAITQTQRRRDALGALRWLAGRQDVDAGRLVLLGWSNGGSTVLSATNLTHAEVAAPGPRPRAAVAFYPGCEAEQRRGYQPSAPLLLLVGAADDWTPAAPCMALTDTSGPPQPQLRVYPDAYHGFDSPVAVRKRSDVPNGVNPGAGVHVGGQPEARQASRQALLEFLREALR